MDRFIYIWIDRVEVVHYLVMLIPTLLSIISMGVLARFNGEKYNISINFFSFWVKSLSENNNSNDFSSEDKSTRAERSFG